MKKYPSGVLKRPLIMPADCLSAIEFVDMMLPPRLHLDLLISGSPTHPEHLTSIAGVFNVATALAYLHRDARAIPFYESAGACLLDIARCGLSEEATALRLIRYFNAAVRNCCVPSNSSASKSTAARQRRYWRRERGSRPDHGRCAGAPLKRVEKVWR